MWHVFSALARLIVFSVVEFTKCQELLSIPQVIFNCIFAFWSSFFPDYFSLFSTQVADVLCIRKYVECMFFPSFSKITRTHITLDLWPMFPAEQMIMQFVQFICLSRTNTSRWFQRCLLSFLWWKFYLRKGYFALSDKSSAWKFKKSIQFLQIL